MKESGNPGHKLIPLEFKPVPQDNQAPFTPEMKLFHRRVVSPDAFWNDIELRNLKLYLQMVDRVTNDQCTLYD